MADNIEVWLPIKGYENLYEVSNKGRIRSLNRLVKKWNGNRTIKGFILKQYVKRGYYQIRLSKNGAYKYYQVHRLVAIAFIPNPKNLPCINHRDENRLNNCIENLEWCSYEYNNQYGTRGKKISNTHKNRYDCSRPVRQKLNGTIISTFPSLGEAARQTGINRSNIGSCCRGIEHFNTAGGYSWEFADS